MAALSFLVADDHAAVRRTIRSLVESHPKWRVSGEAKNGREAIEEAKRLKPDVVLLDITMPEVDGLEATRRILKNAPDTNVLILTTHQSDELSDQVRRAGAKGICLKSKAEESLAAAIDLFRGGAIHLAGSVVGRFRHIAFFFQSKAEEHRVLAPFFAEGLSQGDKEVHVIEPPSRDHHFRRLQEAGIDVDRAAARGQLELLSWEKMYLIDGQFDQDAMIGRLQKALAAASDQGFARTRLVGHMEWALEDLPGVRNLAEYEARVNELPLNFEDVAVCAYDLTRFSASLIVDILRSHPAVIIGGALHDQPFYTPPDRMIAELEQRENGKQS